MQTPRKYHGLVYSAGTVYLLGGNDQFDNETSTFYQYIIASNYWEPLPDLPKTIRHASAISFENTLYFSGNDTRFLFTYN